MTPLGSWVVTRESSLINKNTDNSKCHGKTMVQQIGIYILSKERIYAKNPCLHSKCIRNNTNVLDLWWFLMIHEDNKV